ncbi:lysosomal alpha-glucosidase-like [Chrysoperla carnea]|uniref:lysosomal alpha-glucosidase-like n=1 Tax=Chrysoperla carnea TaxID=189513 RepID=UPI001D07625B|nr:lysosomal alpha-glucosidase-like [Chrysoperla carnea]
MKKDLPNPPKPDSGRCVVIKDNEKFDCHPEEDPNQEKCERRGCCWSPKNTIYNKTKNTPLDTPYCYYPVNYGGYNFSASTSTYVRTFKSPYPNDITELKLSVAHRTANCMNIRITPNYPLPVRYESPFPMIMEQTVDSEQSNLKYSMNKDIFGFKVFHKDGSIIFDMAPNSGFIYADQFLQISSNMPKNSTLYGIGERRGNLRIDTKVWQNFVLFNADQPPAENMNLYGSHPFYLVKDESIQNPHYYGVWMLNSNAIEIIVQPNPAITIRTLGGILDFYIFSGPTPESILQEYHKLIGLPHMPPLWALGFHLCRYGTKTLNKTKEIFLRNKNAGIPIDVQWNDLDYMEANNDFTYDKNSFKDLANFIHELHDQGVKWVPLVDIGISGSEANGTYPPYDLGVNMDIFVKNYTGGIFIGKVWNGKSTVWPDFSHKNVLVYWQKLFQDFHNELSFDGIWLDMNEPSNFYNGAENGCPDTNLENPPYLPRVNGGMLRYKTFCMTAKHEYSDHYNLHNVYGALEVYNTYRALRSLGPNRPFIISRSSFSGLGHYAGHWSGDVFSTWHDLKRTVSEMLSFSLFGIPLMGADICGFNWNTTVELCARWYQLGAFYPFSRTHNTDDAIAQDPTALGDKVLNAAKKSLLTRYSLISYLYTLFYRANQNGSTVARPLFVEFHDDKSTYGLDEQFLWGPSLMIIPVLDEGKSKVNGYLPKGIWYDFYSGVSLQSGGEFLEFNAALDSQIPLLLRGGRIITTQKPELTTSLTIKNPIKIMVGLSEIQTAIGEVYFDDGVTFSGNGSLFSIDIKNGVLNVSILEYNYKNIPKVNEIVILGKTEPVSSVIVNEKNVTTFNYDSTLKVLKIVDLNADISNLLVSYH